MAEHCEIRVYVRSRRVVTSAREVRTVIPVAAFLSGPVYTLSRRVEVGYGRRLDREQSRVLVEARRLAAETGNRIHLVDLGRMNPVVRLFRLALLGGRAFPVVILKGSCPWPRVGEPEHPAPNAVARA